MKNNDNYIKLIAEVRSISIASEIIGISQPGLSSYLKKKEKELGALIFDRSRQPLELTDAGRIYLEYVEKQAALEKEMTQSIADIEALNTGKLTIGGASFFNITYLPKALSVYNEIHPGIEIEILDDKVPELVTNALKGLVDLFFTPINDDDRFAYEKLLEEKIFIAVPEKWEINDKLKDKLVSIDHIRNGDLSNLVELDKDEFRSLCEGTFVVLKQNQDIGRKMHALFDRFECAPKRTIIAEQTMTTLALTQASVGASMITESSLRAAILSQNQCIYYAGSDICNRSMFIAYPRNKYLSNAARKFIEVLKENN